MPPDVNAQPSRRSGEPPRPAFMREMRGQAPQAPRQASGDPAPRQEEQLRRLSAELRRLTAELHEAHDRIRELEIDLAARAASGARVEQLLQAAHEQAAEYVRAVRSEAD